MFVRRTAHGVCLLLLPQQPLPRLNLQRCLVVRGDFDRIDERRTEIRGADLDFVSRLIFPITTAETQFAGAEEMQVDIAWPPMLRILEVMVLAVGQ